MKAVVISFNWDTKETLHTIFEDDKCWIHASNWCDKSSFLWKDFPKKEGWEHFMCLDDEAAEARADYWLGMFPDPLEATKH